MTSFAESERIRIKNIVDTMFPTNKIIVGWHSFRIAVIENRLVVFDGSMMVFNRFCLEIDTIIKTEATIIILCKDYVTFQINNTEEF